MAEIKLDATLNPDSLLLLPQLYEYCVSKSVNRLYWIFLHSTDQLWSICPMKGRADEPGDKRRVWHSRINMSGVYQ